MKKIALTIAIILGLGLTSFADPNGGGLFQRGATSEDMYFGSNRDATTPMLPTHGLDGNQDAEDTPVGSGIAVLLGLGGAYLVAKKRKEE